MDIFDDAVQWIYENFPPPETSDTEIRYLKLWAARKGLFLQDQILRLVLILRALHRMDTEKKSIKALHQRATFQEALQDEIQKNVEQCRMALDMPPGDDFLDNIKRITAWGYSILGANKKDDHIEDALTILNIYRHVFPRLKKGVSASFVLAMSHAENQFTALTTDEAVKILNRESGKRGSSGSLNILASRGKKDAPGSKHDKAEARRVYAALSDRAKRSEKKSEVYNAFLKKQIEMRIKWEKIGKKWEEDGTFKSVRCPPSPETFFDMIKTVETGTERPSKTSSTPK